MKVCLITFNHKCRWQDFLFGLLCFITMTGVKANAQRADSLPAPSPLYVQVMREWAKATDFPKKGAELAFENFRQTLARDPKAKIKMSLALEKDVKQFFYELFFSSEMMKDLAALYSGYFTIEEMQNLIEFYKTPLGQKLINASPEIALKSQQLSAKLLKAHEREWMEVLKKYMVTSS